MPRDDDGSQECALETESPLDNAVREMKDNLAGIGGLVAPPNSATTSYKSLDEDERSPFTKEKTARHSPRTPTKSSKSFRVEKRSLSGKTKRQHSDFMQERTSPAEKYGQIAASIRDLGKDVDDGLADINAGRKSWAVGMEATSAFSPHRQKRTKTALELIATMGPKTDSDMSFDFSDYMRSFDAGVIPVRSPKSKITQQRGRRKLAYHTEHDEESGGVSLEKDIKTYYEEMNEGVECDNGVKIAQGRKKKKTNGLQAGTSNVDSSGTTRPILTTYRLLGA